MACFNGGGGVVSSPKPVAISKPNDIITEMPRSQDMPEVRWFNPFGTGSHFFYKI